MHNSTTMRLLSHILVGLVTAAVTVSGNNSSNALPAAYDYVLTPVYNTSNITGELLLPQVHIVNVPLNDIDGVKRNAKGHLITSTDSSAFSIQPPIGGCGYNRSLVTTTARLSGCSIASNAGFFDIKNTTHPHCLGNVISDSVVIQRDPQHRNVHFGLTSNGHWFTGYVNDALINQHKLNSISCTNTSCPVRNNNDWTFEQLVSGAIQLVKGGQSYVNQSITLEDSTIQTTGNNTYFSEVLAGRTAVGVLNDGRLGMIQIDGKTGLDGIDLFTLADLMVELGFVEGINFDGGGSTAAAVEGYLVSEPSDSCDSNNKIFGCERAVTTIACIKKSKQYIVA